MRTPSPKLRLYPLKGMTIKKFNWMISSDTRWEELYASLTRLQSHSQSTP